MVEFGGMVMGTVEAIAGDAGTGKTSAEKTRVGKTGLGKTGLGKRESGKSGVGRIAAGFLALMLVSFVGGAQTTADPWAGWQFLLGTFDAGESSGAPGSASSGSFTLAQDLNGNVLVRRNHADYPASKDRAAFSHDDLMIVWHEGGATKALYHDSEGHVIHYNVSLSGDGKQIVFLSENAAGPQYRLTYDDLGNGAVKILFEVAAPGSGGEFAKYIEATVHRKNG